MTYTLFIIIEIIVSIFLILVVLMQASKGGGLAGTLGSANMGTVFGVRRTSDFLSKTTTILATIYILLALFINLTVLPRPDEKESIIQQNSSVPPPATQIPQPAPTQNQPK
jgi:preprotein translocase subunit SecG